MKQKKARNAKTSNARTLFLGPPRLKGGDPTPAAMAHALAEWAASAATMLEQPDDDRSNRWQIEDRVVTAYRAVHWGHGAKVTDADVREMIEDAIRSGAKVLRGKTDEFTQVRAIRMVRESIAIGGWADAGAVGVSEQMMLDALRAVNNRGGYGKKAAVKLPEALDAIWKALGVRASDAARTQRRRKLADI